MTGTQSFVNWDFSDVSRQGEVIFFGNLGVSIPSGHLLPLLSNIVVLKFALGTKQNLSTVMKMIAYIK